MMGGAGRSIGSVDTRVSTAALFATILGRVGIVPPEAIVPGLDRAGGVPVVAEVYPHRAFAKEGHWRAIYQGNVFTPLKLVKTFLPSMLEQGSGTIMNMVSLSAFTNPPAAGDKGGWGFAYPSSKAAVARMAGSLRAEHPKAGLRVFNLEPGTVMTEVMRMLGIDEAVMARYKPCSPATIAAVVAWLADNDPSPAWEPEDVLHGPAIAKELKLLQAPSLLDN